MEKKIRNAVRCFYIKDNKVICIKTKTNKIGFIDIPGGKIEDNETMQDAAIREFKEETGTLITNPIFRGIIYVNYPDKSYKLNTFITEDYSGVLTNSIEHDAFLLDINELLKINKRFSCTIMLEPSFLKVLYDKTKSFELFITITENEDITEIKFTVTNI